ncbi:iron ABC transporter permease [Hydrotalea sp.]|uniref:FecCD family ABC transporter permease n=1 Tax=Hydrotalea sp. TaxID=2881279 RepID=UPI00261DE60D|nr:iron ABC transporter permease [Hydrotalea sp.]
MQHYPKLYFVILLVLLVITLIIAIVFGAIPISVHEMYSAISHSIKANATVSLEEAVFLDIRLPRVLLCAITGGILAASGVMMQGLFRNPIVEPGLTGTSAGAAFGASFIFVLSGRLPIWLQQFSGIFLVPVFAFAGGVVATVLVYTLAKSVKRVSVTNLLLIGIAINAIALSGTGFLSFISRDPQARSITFWNLGSFAGASWMQAGITALVTLPVMLLLWRYTNQLNALMMGDKEAGYLGVHTERLKWQILLLNTAMVAVATAFVGVIAFVGLIVPHMMRLFLGGNNRVLLPASFLCGAILLTVADITARLLIAPGEIPIGIITSLVGAPVFILLLKKSQLLQKGGSYD